MCLYRSMNIIRNLQTHLAHRGFEGFLIDELRNGQRYVHGSGLTIATAINP